MAEKIKKKLRMWQLLLGIAVALALIVAAVMVVHNLIGGKSDKPKKPPQISLIPNTPPPPPPPPPKEEKKPDPPKDQKEVKEVPTNEVKAPPDPQLKMEGAAGDGPSAFGAGKVTSEDLSRLGGGGMFSPFNSYASLMKSELQRQLSKRSELRQRVYRIEVRVWVGDNGAVKKTELIGTTGDADTDDSIRQALFSFPTFSEGPPPNMPQPIRLRIVTSGRG